MSADADFRNVFHALPSACAVLSLSPGGVKIEDLSDGFIDLFGLTPADARPVRLDDVFSSAVVTLIDGATRKAIRHPEHMNDIISQRIVTTRGEIGVALRVVGLPDRTSVLLVVEPIARGGAQDGKPRAAALSQLDAVSDSVIFIYDVEKSRTHYISSRAETLLGRPIGAAGIEQIRAVVHPADIGNVMRRLAMMISSPEDQVMTVTFRVKDAARTWKWMEARGRVLSRNKRGGVRRIIGVASDVTDRHELNVALQEASNAIIQAGETERRRIARELHDSTVQHLVTLDWGLSELRRRYVEDDIPDNGIFEELRSALEAAQREIRVFAYMLHPPKLDQRGFVETLKRFAHGVSKRASIEVDVDVQGVEIDLPQTVELALFRIAQEALMNVHRHASAHSACVRVLYCEDSVVLEVEDDGVGLSSGAASDAEAQGGVGIAGMRARMAQLGGMLEIESSSQGWLVRALLPKQAISRIE